MQLTRNIALDVTPGQFDYLNPACGTSRRVWSWALGKWSRQYAAGQEPNAGVLGKRFSSTKYNDLQWLDESAQPWLLGIHRGAHVQPFANPAKAWNRFFADIKCGKPVHESQPKKGRCDDGFYLARDKFSVNGRSIRLPKVGEVAMMETLRFDAKILGETVARTANRRFVARQAEVPDTQFCRARRACGVAGIDLGIKAASTCSSGVTMAAPKPLNAAPRRWKIRGRRISRKTEATKVDAGLAPRAKPSKGTRPTDSRNCRKSSATLVRLHARIANDRADFTRKSTTRICRQNQTVVSEELHVRGMLANGKLARAIRDVGVGVFRAPIGYRAKHYRIRLVVAGRCYLSSRLCSVCDRKKESLTLKDRKWTCPQCGTHRGRDVSSDLNSQRLATASALPMVSLSGNRGTTAETVSAVAWKVTLVRYECGQQDASGQEKNHAHLRALSW